MAYGVTSTTLCCWPSAPTPPPRRRPCTWPRSGPPSPLSGAWPTGGSTTSTGRSSRRSASPGAAGAFAGATSARTSTEAAAPVMSLDPAHARLYTLIRFTAFGLPKGNLGKPTRKRFPAPLGPLAGNRRGDRRRRLGRSALPRDPGRGRMEPRQGHRLDRRQRVPRRHRRPARLPGRHRLGEHRLRLGRRKLLLGGVIAAPIAAWLVAPRPAGILGSPPPAS